MQVSIDGEFIAQCAAAVSDVDRPANDGIRPVKEVLKEWFPELTVEEQLDPLLALRATGTDFTSISDSIPSWLIGTGSELGSNAPQEAVERFTGLRQLFLDTQRALTR